MIVLVLACLIAQGNPEGATVTLVINYLSAESIASRRTELFASARLSLEELRAKGKFHMLDPDKHAILRELEDLGYLGGAD
jgi:hypothetical protein